MYSELGGYQGYQKTPVKVLHECQLSIIAEIKYQAELDEENEQEQEVARRELERQRARMR